MSVQAELNVEDMSCEHCKATVEKAITAFEGVKKVDIDLGAKKVTITYDEGKVNLVDLKQAIMAEGYAVMEI